MKFRKKPVVIEAEQFFTDKKPWPAGVHERVDYAPNGNYVDIGIDTLEGFHVVSDGYWIITGVKGEQYGCAPDIFELTYEPVEE